MRNKAAVTICSINYIAKALVLFESYRQYHPDHDFYVVIVDRKNSDLTIEHDGLTVIWAEDLSIPNFHQAAFSFDVIEFNTNVKPTALKLLLNSHDLVVYLDPDIEVFAPLTPVFEGLENASIVLTPHCNTPILDGCKPDDLEFLKFGTFNLGFVAVSKCDEAFSFLDWWSARCLEHGFYEPQVGLAVDQKWVSLAPSYFPNLKVLHDIGLNLAFWNLHERHLSLKDEKWMVNNEVPLRFIHFSSFNASKPEIIAQKQNRFAPGSRPDFESAAKAYAAKLIAAESEKYGGHKYGFDYFDDGTYITPALRRFYAALRSEKFSEVANPFKENSPVMDFAKRNGLLVRGNVPAKRHNFHDMKSYNFQIKMILKMFRFALFVIGPERYFNLMRYLAHISSLRNQTDIFDKRK
ncbi:glycosyl transferase [Collimonas pratensis]|uniref:glycosyl transferase n=1 Tax=Collimonas pratensis TaxID=279113 RepID=UPI00143CE7E6|nr:glycosyl transferase [Collimonas pratensis]NKI67890.1 glycosyl transferase [Collimonas pratensis]